MYGYDEPPPKRSGKKSKSKSRKEKRDIDEELLSRLPPAYPTTDESTEDQSSDEEYVPHEDHERSSGSGTGRVMEHDTDAQVEASTDEDSNMRIIPLPAQSPQSRLKKLLTSERLSNITSQELMGVWNSLVCEGSLEEYSSGQEYAAPQSHDSLSESETEQDIDAQATASDRPNKFSVLPPPVASEPFGIQKCQVARKRVYDKRHCCVFCNKLCCKLARHLEHMHASEPEVAVALKLPKASKERRLKFSEIMKKGDFAYNKKVIETKSGLIIPSRRPAKSVDASGYLPCCHCFGIYLRKDLWRHVKNCSQKDNSPHNTSHQVSGRMLMPISQDLSYRFKSEILGTMVKDEITSTVFEDPLILAFGERLFLKAADKEHQYNYVKQKLRELARFLLNIKTNKSSGIECLKDCIDPAMFKMTVASVRDVCKCDDDGKYGIPSLALKIGHSLKKCAILLKSQALQDNNEELKQKAASFLELYFSDWAVETSASLQTIHERPYNKPKWIPLTQDLRLLSEYLEEIACSLKTSLDGNHEPNIDAWNALNEVTLCQIALFNRRQGGETDGISVANYKASLANNAHTEEEVFDGLSAFEKHLAATLDRIEIDGERGRKVPVLLTKGHQERIDCLLQHRLAVGVHSENSYLFARCGDSLASLRSWDLLRKYAAACGAKQPSLLTSTALRKRVATISQILSLKSCELDSLANFLGHHIHVDQDFYRLPEDTVQLAKVSNLLVELERGNISKYAGKSLAQIDIDCDEELHKSEFEQEMPEDEEIEMGDVGLEEDDGRSVRVDNKSSTCMAPKKLKKTKRKIQGTRKLWSPEEKDAVERQLGKYFTSGGLPGKSECEEAIRKEPVLNQRPWAQIKFFIKNTKAALAHQMNR